MGNRLSECNICYTKVIKYKECNLCKNCIVCIDCLNKMDESLKIKCPLCRQENWLIEKINDDKRVFPLNNILQVKVEDNNHSKEEVKECFIDINKFFKIIGNIFKIIIYFFTIWVLGIITLICITNNPKYLNGNLGIFFLATILGISEFLICWCICCKNINLREVIFS